MLMHSKEQTIFASNLLKLPLRIPEVLALKLITKTTTIINYWGTDHKIIISKTKFKNLIISKELLKNPAHHRTILTSIQTSKKSTNNTPKNTPILSTAIPNSSRSLLGLHLLQHSSVLLCFNEAWTKLLITNQISNAKVLINIRKMNSLKKIFSVKQQPLPSHKVPQYTHTN